jgi:hypothetical protein
LSYSGACRVRYPESMADLIEIECPCCKTVIKVDAELRAVISHKQLEKAPAIEDMAAAVAKLRGEAARREEVFQKSFADQKTRQSVLDKKFDELLKQAKANPDTVPPKRDFDLD